MIERERKLQIQKHYELVGLFYHTLEGGEGNTMAGSTRGSSKSDTAWGAELE